MPRFEIDFLTEYTDEALLGELRRIAALLPAGEPLTKTAYQRHSPNVAHTTLRRRFGGWKEALERAGLGYLYHGQPISQKMRSQPAKDLSNADLLAELKRVHALVGKEWLTSDQSRAPVSAPSCANAHADASPLPHTPWPKRLTTSTPCADHPRSTLNRSDNECWSRRQRYRQQPARSRAARGHARRTPRRH